MHESYYYNYKINNLHIIWMPLVNSMQSKVKSVSHNLTKFTLLSNAIDYAANTGSLVLHSLTLTIESQAESQAMQD